MFAHVSQHNNMQNLATFLAQHRVRKRGKESQSDRLSRQAKITHTSMGQDPGSFSIPEESTEMFIQLYMAAIEDRQEGVRAGHPGARPSGASPVHRRWRR